MRRRMASAGARYTASRERWTAAVDRLPVRSAGMSLRTSSTYPVTCSATHSSHTAAPAVPNSTSDLPRSARRQAHQRRTGSAPRASRARRACFLRQRGLFSVLLQRSPGRRDEQAAPVFELPRVGSRADSENVMVGLGSGVAAGVAADKDDSQRAALGNLFRQPLGRGADGFGKAFVRAQRPCGAVSRRSGRS